MIGVTAVRLACTQSGPAAGLPVALLHGFPLDRWMWAPQAAELAAAGYRVLAPDLRGHGASPVAKGAWSIADAAADVFALADALGIERFVLAGFSMGGHIAFEAYAQNPERIVGLVLAGTRAEPDSPAERGARLATAESVRREGTAILADRMIPKFFTEQTRQERPALVEEVRARILATPPEGAAGALLAMASRRDQRPLLPNITVPTLVLVGEEDPITPPGAAREIHRRVKGAFLQVLTGAAHLAPLESPGTFTQALLNWMTFNEWDG